MIDTVDKQARGRIMGTIRGKHTSLEIPKDPEFSLYAFYDPGHENRMIDL